jgi:hypothetical protein
MNYVSVDIRSKQEISSSAVPKSTHQFPQIALFQTSYAAALCSAKPAPCMQVRECLMFSAQLRLPGNLTTAEKAKQVDDILEELVRYHSTYLK